MAGKNVTCAACGKSYPVEEGMEKSFCVFCGVQNPCGAVQAAPHEALARKAFFEQMLVDGTQNTDAQDALALWPVRFQAMDRAKTRYADTFVGLWTTLSVLGRDGVSRGALKQINKELERFFGHSAMKAALENAAHPSRALYRELLDAARLYVATCKTDRHYTSTMLGMMRLKEKDIAEKAANEFVQFILLPVYAAQHAEYTPMLVGAIYWAYRAEYPDDCALIDRHIAGFAADVKSGVEAILRRYADV